MNHGFNDFWPTTFYHGKIEDDKILEGLANEFFSVRNFDPNYSEKNSFNLFDLKTDSVLKFKNDIVYPAFKLYLSKVFNQNIDDFGYKMKSWFNQSSQPSHNHSGAHLSAVFYILCNNRIDEGNIIFTDPRSNSNRGYPLSFQNIFQPVVYQPVMGDFIVFPSFVYHYVSACSSTHRLCVPVDLFLENKKVK
jgi:hypothetical protein